MNRFSVVKKPDYAVTAADNALQLLVMLRHEPDGLRIQDAANHLGVAPSTAHRLLSTLVYRGFAQKDERHRYYAGPALRGDSGMGGVTGLPSTIAAALTELSRATGETVSLVRRAGTGVEFLGTVESRRPLRVGERTGSVLPAHLTSGGKALLATLGDATVRTLYTSSGARRAGTHLAGQVLDDLVTEMQLVRDTGYALNRGLTEVGICAIGMAVPGEAGKPPWLAVAVSVPSIRAGALTDPATHGALRTCCAALHSALPDAGL